MSAYGDAVRPRVTRRLRAQLRQRPSGRGQISDVEEDLVARSARTGGSVGNVGGGVGRRI